MIAPRVLPVLGRDRQASLGTRLLEVFGAHLEALDIELRVHDLLGDGFDRALRIQRVAPRPVAQSSRVGA